MDGGGIIRYKTQWKNCNHFGAASRSGEEEKLFTLLYFVITSKVVSYRVATELKRGDNILSLFRRVKRAYSVRRSKDSGLEHIK